MKKVCRILHINDGNPETIQNGDFLLVQAFPKMESVLEEFLEEGYELKQIISDYSPAVNEEGNYTFYKSGIIAYLERSV